MSDKSKTDLFVEHINRHILPFVDYSALQASYDSDMVYAKGILNRLHEAMIAVYGSERLGRMDGDDGFVIIPGVVRGRESGKTCLALLELDLSSSGEHWGTSYLCKYGVVSQDGADNGSFLKSETEEINAAYLPYDYGYTATIPGDIHVDRASLPDGIKSVLSDFQNHRAAPRDTLTEKYSCLAAAEMSAEQNYNMLDGRVNNLPAARADLTDGQTYAEMKELAPETLPEERPSVTEKLEAAKRAVKDTPKKPPREKKPSELERG
ncbi:hypothetical protein FACS1894191_1940 [Clostridia bacterium]|nr:hypothetical protein FACS1894191_1940 [Clostridia bacterium]